MATETNIHRESRLANRMLLPPICRKNTKICRPEKIPKTG